MRFAVALLLVVSGCRSLLGFEEATVAIDDAAIDAAIDATVCGDGDGDEICDAVDACPGFDDRVDSDLDGIPDGCDTWPCGVEPAAPGSPVTETSMQGGNETTVVVMDTQLGGQSTRLLVVDPGQTFDLTAGFSIVDCICPTCLDQIQVGIIVPNAVKVCLFDNNPQGNSPGACPTPTTGMATRQLVAPVVPGEYDVRFLLGQDFSCTTSPSWFADVVPGPLFTIAKICVR